MKMHADIDGACRRVDYDRDVMRCDGVVVHSVVCSDNSDVVKSPSSVHRVLLSPDRDTYVFSLFSRSVSTALISGDLAILVEEGHTASNDTLKCIQRLQKMLM